MADKTHAMLRAEAKVGQPLEFVIPYLMAEVGVKRAGKTLGVNPDTVYRWIIRLGIEME